MQPPPRLPEPEKIEYYLAPFNKLRNYSTTLGITFLLDLGRRLRRLDKEKKNRLYREDFIATMKEMNLLSEDESDEVFMDVDIEDRGYVFLDRFLENLRGSLPPMRRKVIEHALLEADWKNDGLIPLEYFEEVWDGTVQTYLGEDKTAEERKLIFLEHLKKDAEREGYVTKEELMNILWAQSLMTEDDIDFVLTLRQAYDLDCPPIGPLETECNGWLSLPVEEDE